MTFVHNARLTCCTGSLEAMADFFVRLLRRVDELNVATFAPDKGAQNDFNQQVEDFMVDSVWSGHCTSWCKLHFLLLFSTFRFLLFAVVVSSPDRSR